MNQKKRRKIISIVSIIVALMIILSCVAPVLLSGAASSSLDSQYEELKKKQTDLEKQQNQIKSDIKDNEQDQDKIKNQIGLINDNIEVVKQQMDILQGSIKECNDNITNKTAEIDKTTKDIEETTETYKERMCALYEVGNVSRLEILLASKNVKDFFTRYEIISTIQTHDTDLVDKLNSQKKTLQQEKEDLNSQKKQLDSKNSSLQQKQDTYDKQSEESKQCYTKLKDSKEAMMQRQDELDKAEDEANKQLAIVIKKKQEEAAEKARAEGASSAFVGGGWLWPIQNMPGQYISSPFGPRAGHSVPHSGVDIAAGNISGHPILASLDGTVIIADYGTRIYGNYVVLDHGGSMTSLYGHCSSLNCKVGQKVKKGDVIGYVGNTGNVVSLGGGGYHLHFQIMKDGVAVNPMNYVKKP